MIRRLPPIGVAVCLDKFLHVQFIDNVRDKMGKVVAGKPLVPRRLGGLKGSVRAAAANVVSKPDAVAKPAIRPAAPSILASVPGLPVMMPNQDLTVTEGTVVRWLKQVGDSVKLNEVIVEVETAKAIVPVESPSTGKLAEILAREGVTVQMTQPLGTVQPV